MVIKEELKIEKTLKEPTIWDEEIDEIIGSSIKLIRDYSSRVDPDYLRSIDILNYSSAVANVLKNIELQSSVTKIKAKHNKDTIQSINKLFGSTKEVLNDEINELEEGD
jgi:L-ribulose-5-phosphate 3-epimerase UlaE